MIEGTLDYEVLDPTLCPKICRDHMGLRGQMFVAHGKVQGNTYETQRQEDGSHFRWERPWDSYLSREAIAKARSDVRSFCQHVVAAMRDKSDHLHLSHDAFEGPLANGSGCGSA